MSVWGAPTLTQMRGEAGLPSVKKKKKCQSEGSASAGLGRLHKGTDYFILFLTFAIVKGDQFLGGRGASPVPPHFCQRPRLPKLTFFFFERWGAVGRSPPPSFLSALALLQTDIFGRRGREALQIRNLLLPFFVPQPELCGWCLPGALLSPTVFSCSTSPKSS